MMLKEASASHSKKPKAILRRGRNVGYTPPRNGENIRHQIRHLCPVRADSSADVAVNGPVMFEVESLESCLGLFVGCPRRHLARSVSETTPLHDAKVGNLSNITILNSAHPTLPRHSADTEAANGPTSCSIAHRKVVRQLWTPLGP